MNMKTMNMKMMGQWSSRCALGLWVVLLSMGLFYPVRAQVSTNRITVTIEGDGSVTMKTNEAALPVPPQEPLSVQWRRAWQEARGLAAPWNQRFIVMKVEEFKLNRVEEDEKGVPSGVSVYTTNYLVTILPVNDTNAPVAWGPSRSRTLQFMTTRRTVKGDGYDFFPIEGTNAVPPLFPAPKPR